LKCGEVVGDLNKRSASRRWSVFIFFSYIKWNACYMHFEECVIHKISSDMFQSSLLFD
jgi:hypothetical protein